MRVQGIPEVWHRDGVAWRNLYRLSDGDGKILKVESEVGKARGEGGGRGVRRRKEVRQLTVWGLL